jgi:hypothetical protein
VKSAIAFRETEQNNSAVGFVPQSMDQSTSSIDDIHHEWLHLFLVPSPDSAARASYYSHYSPGHRVVTARRARRKCRLWCKTLSDER